jgi:hypothetical protein
MGNPDFGQADCAAVAADAMSAEDKANMDAAMGQLGCGGAGGGGGGGGGAGTLPHACVVTCTEEPTTCAQFNTMTAAGGCAATCSDAVLAPPHDLDPQGCQLGTK